ncbi:MAG TPA: sulfotransferase [Rugosimonospora sp.]|nr:sulfotransferase [Rugosimonospora sp.]
MSTLDSTTVGTVADLHASASRVSGLTDFGADDYREALEVLLDSYAHDAALTPAGSKAARVMLRGALVARLSSESAWRQYPEHEQVPVTRPVFVTGLPRTGTTALHRLLSADPAHQGLELWLAEVPQPRPPRDTWADNAVFALLEDGYRQHRLEHPEFMGMHYLSAAEVEECWQLLRQSVMSISFECLAHLPGYSGWLSTQDWTPAYRRHRRNLQLVGLTEPERRWVLKNPSHLFALDALLAVYPDALVVQTHRAPATAIASVCSLNAEASAGWSDRYRGEVLGRDQLELWSRGVTRFLADRAAHDPAQFVDVAYEDLVADPMGTVERIYARLDTPLSGPARTAMAALHEQSVTGDRRPAHRYALADFGLSEGEVNERFADYLAVIPSGR